MATLINRNAEVVLNLVQGADSRVQGMMPGWDLELARQKMLFFMTPAEFPAALESISGALDSAFAAAGPEERERSIGFMLGIAESLLSPVEMDHNLQSKRLHGSAILTDAQVSELQKKAADLVRKWADQDWESFLSVTALIKAEDTGVNKGDNLFIAWAKK